MSFDGNGDYVGLGDTDFDYVDFTVSLWTKNINDITPQHVTNLIGKGNWNSNPGNWYL